MVRISRGRHAHQTALANDPTKDVSANQWNDTASTAHLESGMLGFPQASGNTALSANALLPVDSGVIVQASSSPGSDTLKNITNTNTNQYDVLVLISNGVDTITVNHNDSGSGNVFLLGAVNKVLSTTVPMCLIRVGTNWYEFTLTANIINANVASNAAIAYGKLNLTGSVVNADISNSAAIVYSKLNLSNSIVNADINTSAAIAPSKISGTAAILGANTFTGLQTLNAGLTMSGSNIALGTNRMKTANFDMYEVGAAGQDGMSIIPFNSIGGILNVGTGVAGVSAIQLVSTTDFTTNYDAIRLDNGITAGNQWSVTSFKGGTGIARPIAFYMSTTKLLSFDTANTVTLYVNLTAVSIIASGQIVAGGATPGNTYHYFSANQGGANYPSTQNTTFALGDNFSAGGGEVTFWNTQATANTSFVFYQQTGASAGTKLLTLEPHGSLIVGPLSALSTSATDGFLYIPSGNGAPTGVPTAFTGKIALYYDSTNNFLYVYNGGWKKSTVYA